MSAPQASASQPLPQSLSIRRASPADADACGKICYEAFGNIAAKHNFPPDIPSPEMAQGFLRALFAHTGFFCVVAENDGEIIGSNCLDERTPIAGIGPITISPAAQNGGTGRRLMQAVMDRAAERKFPAVRLVQAGYHSRSLSLYAKLGFVVREPLACMHGPAIRTAIPGLEVRPARMGDLAACNRLALRVHGHDRGGELRDAIQQGSATLVESRGRVSGYASSLSFFGHAVAETNDDLQAIIAASEILPPGILVPTRNAALFRWCLENGLRTVYPMNLMTLGLYNEPAGAFLPSVTF
jgi:predicted N-acetyltransferase YhbS